MPGPLQVIAVSFSPGSDFQARVLAELDRLQGRGVFGVLLDVIFVAKNDDGTIEPVVVGGDDDDLVLFRRAPCRLAAAVLSSRRATLARRALLWLTRGRWQSPCCQGRRSLCSLVRARLGAGAL